MPTRDEGPSPEDLERFGGDTGYCPECGAEIWDEADVCPTCGAFVSGEVTSRPPVESWFRKRWILLVAILALIAFLLLML